MAYVIHVGDATIEATSHTNAVAVYNINVDVTYYTKVNASTGMVETEVIRIASMPACIKWKSGREKVMFNKDTHYLDAILRCRIVAGSTILVTDRIKYNSLVYEIVDLYDVNNLGKLLVIALKRMT